MALPEQIQNWYSGMLALLQNSGYDLLDPMSSTALEGFSYKNINGDPWCVDQESFFVGAENKNGSYVRPTGQDFHSLGWMQSNLKPPAGLSDAQITQMYRLAQEGRLVFHPKSGSRNLLETRLVYTDVSGLPRLSAPLNDLPDMTEFNPSRILSAEENRRFCSAAKKCFPGAGNVEPLAVNLSQYLIGQRDFRLSLSELRPARVIEAKANRMRHDALLLNDYYTFPEYYADPVLAEKRYRSISTEFYPQEPAADNEVLYASVRLDPIRRSDIRRSEPGTEKKLLEMIAASGESFDELLKSGRLQRADGTPFRAGTTPWEALDCMVFDLQQKRGGIRVTDAEGGVRKLSYNNSTEKLQYDVPFPAPAKKAEPAKAAPAAPSLPDHIVADVSDAEQVRFGGEMSSRMRMSVQMENGTTVDGFFTRNISTDATAAFAPNLLARAKTLEADGTPGNLAAAKFFRDLSRIGAEQFYDIMCTATGRTDPGDILKRQPFGDNPGPYVADLQRGFQAAGVTLDGNMLRTNADFQKALSGMLEENIGLYISQFTQERFGIAMGRNANRRNNAMSDIAARIGEPDLVARSVNMTVVSNGEAQNGTFMVNAKGMELRQFSPKMKGFRNGHMTIAPEGLRSISKLQVLDFICGNLDRHRGNLFYQFDTTKNPAALTGVQGIDNDFSFTMRTAQGAGTEKYMSALGDIRFIDKQQALGILTMDSAAFEQTLRLAGLAAQEVEAAKLRLNSLKTNIREGKITMLDEAQWQKAQFKSFATPGNLFSITQQAFDQYTQNVMNRTLPKPLDTTAVLKAGEARNESVSLRLQAQQARLEELRKELDATGGLKGASEEFKTMYRSLEATAALTAKLAKTAQAGQFDTLRDNDFNLLSDSYAELQKACSDYAKAKRAAPRTERGRARLHAAKNLSALAADSRHSARELTTSAMNEGLRVDGSARFKGILQSIAEHKVKNQPIPPQDAGRYVKELSAIAAKHPANAAILNVAGNATAALLLHLKDTPNWQEAAGLTETDLQAAKETVAGGRKAAEKLNARNANPKKAPEPEAVRENAEPAKDAPNLLQ